MEQIKKNEKTTYLIGSSLIIYIIIILVKEIFYSLFNININNIERTPKLIIDITYQIFAIVMSINFYVKTRKLNIDELKNYLKDVKKGTINIIIYCITSLIEIASLYYSTKIFNINTILGKSIILIITETLIMSVIFLINKKDLIKDIKDMKKNWNKYFTENLKYYIYALIIMIISNLLITKINPQIAGNEQLIRDQLQKAPVYIFFSCVFFAPFTEEMIFRKSIRYIVKDNLTYIITSGLIFGGLHVIGNINTIYDVLYIIPYSAPGIAFAYILTKTDNILVSMGIHFMHNGLLMVLQLLI